MKLKLVLFAFSLVILSVDSSYAQTRRRNTKSLKVQCPKIVASQREGTYFNRSSNAKRFPFMCFETTRNAKKAGYASIAAAALRSYSGWYRIPFKLSRTNCAGVQPSSIVNMFMQVKEKDGGIFGQVCPGNYRYSGSRTSTGFVVSLSRSLTEASEGAKCPGSKLEVTDVVQFENVNDFAVTNITYTKTEQCESSAISYSCSTEYTGSAIREQSDLFPGVHGDLNSLPLSCDMAIQNCGECHGGS